MPKTEKIEVTRAQLIIAHKKLDKMREEVENLEVKINAMIGETIETYETR